MRNDWTPSTPPDTITAMQWRAMHVLPVAEVFAANPDRDAAHAHTERLVDALDLDDEDAANFANALIEIPLPDDARLDDRHRRSDALYRYLLPTLMELFDLRFATTKEDEVRCVRIIVGPDEAA
jgi:hypothetical protein